MKKKIIGWSIISVVFGSVIAIMISISGLWEVIKAFGAVAIALVFALIIFYAASLIQSPEKENSHEEDN